MMVQCLFTCYIHALLKSIEQNLKKKFYLLLKMVEQVEMESGFQRKLLRLVQILILMFYIRKCVQQIVCFSEWGVVIARERLRGLSQIFISIQHKTEAGPFMTKRFITARLKQWRLMKMWHLAKWIKCRWLKRFMMKRC